MKGFSMKRGLFVLIAFVIALTWSFSSFTKAAVIDVNDFGGVFGTFVNNRMIDARVGLVNDTVTIGFNTLYFPAGYGTNIDGDDEGTFAFGLYGEVATPEIAGIGDFKLASLWNGLVLKGFTDVNLDYNFSEDCAFVAPGAGVRIAPTKYFSLAFRAYYPMSDDEDAVGGVEFNEMFYSLGVVINTK
jgi:hypothetical protein